MSTRRRAEPANEHALPHQAGPARSAAPGDPGAGVPDDPGAGVPGDPGAAGAAPAGERAPAAAPVLSVTGLRVGFPAPGTRRVTPAVRGIDLTVRPGECLALVGQSGSGKSVTARALLGLVGGHAVVEAARLRLGETDLLALSRRAWRRVRGARIGMVLQDALTSLDPLRPVGREIDDALRLHTRLGPAGRRARMLQALADAGIADPELRAAGRSDELSGGQRQRALIAAAIVLNPALIIADEPTTALDVAVESQVLDTFGGLRDRGTALLLISHDLSVVARVADRVAVMHDGLIVEEGTAAEVLRRPRHPYTVELVGAVPEGRPRGTLLSLAGRGSATNAAPRPGVRPSPVTPHAADALRACVAPAAGGHPHAAPRQAPASRDVAVAALELRGVSRAFHTPEGTRPAV
ncbi:MAG TPA: ABC transporter ATP-binding protein, partial [Microbacteriaceae bacterium]|nr:ABC transporter ATP-binding protein [Microbacteriaceae bacterium]